MAGNNNMSAMDRLLSEVRSGQAKPASQSSARTQTSSSPRSSNQSASDSTINSLQRRLAEADKRIANDDRSRKNSGVYNAVSAVGDYLPILESRREQLKADRDSIAADIEDIKRSRQEINKSGGYGKGGIGAAFQRGVGQAQSTQNALEALIGDVEQEDLEGIVAGRARVQNNARNKSEQDAYERFQAADGFLASAREIFTNPRLLANVAIESIPSSMYSMVGGVVGGVGGAAAGTLAGGPAGTVIGGRVGGAAGSGIGSFATEYGSAMLETFERNGIDLDDPEALKAAIDDPKLMEEAKERGLRRGIAVAAFDALSVGLAGKLGGGQIARRVGGDIAEAGAGRRAGAVLAGGAAETVSQGALGAGGEASAQLLADGRITSPQDIVAEFAGELPTGAIEATVGTGAEYLRKDASNQPNAMEDEELAAALAARGEANPVREGGGLLEDQNAAALRGLGNISAGGMNYTPDKILDIARNNESNPRIADIMSQPVSDVTKVEQVARILNQEEASRVEPEAVRRISGMFGGTNSVSTSKQMIGDELAKINPAVIAESPTLSSIAKSLESTGKQFVSGLRNAVSNYQPTAQTGTLFARPERGGKGSVIMSQEDVTNEAQREREAQQAFRLADVRQRRFDTATGELTQREDLRAGAPEPENQFFLNPAVYGEDLGGIAATIVGAEGGKVRIQYESPTEVDGNGTPVIISEDVDPTAMFDRVVRGTPRMSQELAGDLRKPRKGTGTDLNPRQSVDRTSTRALVPTQDAGLPTTISPTRMTGFEANTDQLPVEQQVQNAQVNPQQERLVNLEGIVEGPNEISGPPATPRLQAPEVQTAPAEEATPTEEAAPTEAEQEPAPKKPAQDDGGKVEKHVENIEDKILNDDRNGVVRYATKVHKEGLIDDADLAEIKRMSKDKDMGAEDIGPELISQLNTKRDDGDTRYSGRRETVRAPRKKASDVVRDTPLNKDKQPTTETEAEAKPEIDYEAVIQDRLDKLAARGGQGKIVSRRLRSLLKENNYNATQVYYAFQMGEVVSRVLPSNSKVDVLFVPSITATDPSAAAASGIDLGDEASGSYRAYTLSQNGFRGLITLSLNPNLADVARENAAHEAFHVIQDFLQVDYPDLYNTINSSFRDGMRIKDLDPSILRKLKTLKTDREGSVYDSLIADFGDTPLGAFEAQAVAFGALVDAKDRGVDMKGMKASFIRFVDFLSDMLRGFRNIFRINSVDSVAEIFDGFRTGEISKGFTEPAPLADEDRGEQYSGRVPKNPAVTSSLEHNFNILQNKSFRKGRDLKMFIQERVKSSLDESGINAEDYEANETFKYLTKMAVKDAEYALQENANAIGWYDEKVSKALAVLSLVHPEIATDRQSKFAFIWALAVSSNGLKVNPNFEIAEKAYRIYKETGQMPTDIGIGTAADAIDGHMKLFNVMMNKLGFDELERLMTTKATVKEIESETGISVSGEGKAETVFGAAILGPKIGNGFFANLYGHFDQLTMDRWLMRTWGRWTGTLVSVKEQNVEKGRDVLSRLVAALSNEQRSELGSIIGLNVDNADADTIAVAIQKSSIKPANRTKISDIGRGNTAGLEDIVGKQKGRFEQVGLGDEIRKKGNGLAGYLDGQKEAPAGANERKYIRSVFQSTLTTLKKKYPKLTTADLQALLWYPEKRLYEAAKTDEVNEGYDDDNAPDYANAAILVAKNAGVSDEQIRQANEAVDARLRSNVSSAGAGRGGAGVSEQYSGRSGRTDQDLATKLRSRFEGAPRVEEGSSTEGNVGRRSGGVLANSVTGRVPVAATYSHSTAVKDLFNENGFDTPDFHELTRGKAAGKLYTRLINDSKQDNRFGASVYVYPENEYQDMRLFVTKDGMSGFALKGDDIVSAFKSPKSADRGVAFSMIRMAVALGGRKLDAFDTVLPSIYSVSGFKAVARMRWNEEFKPDDWNKETFKAFNGGEPDVVFMAYDQNREGLYSPDEGEYTDSYDQAVAAQGGDVQYSGRTNRAVAAAAALAASPVNATISDTPIVENSAVYKSLEQGKTRQALAWLRQNSKNEDTRKLSSILVRNGVGDQKTVILDPVDNLDNTVATLSKNGADQESIDLVSMGQVRGMVLATPKDKSIYLIKNPAQGANGVNEQTFLHEAIHAYVKARWSSVGVYGERNREALDNRGLYNEKVAVEVEQFNTMWRGFTDAIKDEFDGGAALPSTVISAAESPNEALSYLLTNKTVQDYAKRVVKDGSGYRLMSVKEASKRSWWDDFVDMIRNIFGLSPSRDQFFNDFLDAGYSVLETGAKTKPDFRVAAINDERYSGRRGKGNASGPQALRPAYSFRSDNYNFGGEAPNKLDEVIYNLQDKLIDVKRIQKNIKDAGGRISETTDVYRAEELFHGRAAKRAKDFVQRELNPLLEEMKTKGVALEVFDEFLHARHAKERNAQIRKINPDMQDKGSGMSDAQADSYLAGLPNARRKQLEKLADRVDAITQSTQQMMVKYGLETQETIDNWNKTYKFYVPLQREGFEEGGSGSSGQGMSVGGSSSRRALGSELGVVDILANVAMQRERVISRGERNRVGNALAALALQNPNDSFWFVIDPKGADAAKAKKKLIDFGMDPADAENVMGSPMTSYIDPNTGRLVKRPNGLFMSSPFVMATRINGEDKFIAFNSRNPRSQRMVTALKNIDAFQMGAFVSGVAKVTRYFAAINTQYNPAFGLYNLMRDLGGASINLSSTAIAGKQRQVIGNALPAALGMYRDLRAERSGKTAATNWAALADEFELEGGKTGFRDLFTTSQDRADAIEIELTGGSKLRQAATKVGGPVFDWLSDFNEAIENGVRLSAYKTAKEAGLSKAEAASIAKNLTVNFNRKGVVGSQAGAFYAFFNASVQGTARLAETLKGPAGKKIIAGGLLLGVAQAVALAAAGIDDEIPDWLKDKNLVIPLGGKKYLAIPMPLGLHVIPSLGRRSVDFFMSGGEKAPEQIIGLMGMMADSFNPIGNAGLSLQTVTPTVLDPFAALAENKDFAGRDIARKDFNSLDPTAGYERNKEGVSAVGDYVARAIDYVTGGNGYTAGTLSPTGDQVDYLIGQATGGVGRLALNTMATAQAAVTGEDLPNYKIPVVGRMIGDANEASAISGRFYDGIKEMNSHKKTVEGMEEDGKDTTSYFQEYPEADFFEEAQDYESDISKLRKEKKQLKEDGASQQEIDYVTEEMQMLMVEFNQRIADYKNR